MPTPAENRATETRRFLALPQAVQDTILVPADITFSLPPNPLVELPPLFVLEQWRSEIARGQRPFSARTGTPLDDLWRRAGLQQQAREAWEDGLPHLAARCLLESGQVAFVQSIALRQLIAETQADLSFYDVVFGPLPEDGGIEVDW